MLEKLTLLGIVESYAAPKMNRSESFKEVNKELNKEVDDNFS